MTPTVAIDFLDVQLSGGDGVITTRLYSKPTAGNALLRADSSHPRHTIRGVPVGQFLRLKCLCSDNLDFIREGEDMIHKFRERGYPETVLNRAFRIASEVPRNNLLLE